MVNTDRLILLKSELLWSVQTMRRDLSCMWLIFLFSSLLWNIRLIHNIQTGLWQTISLKVFFIENSLDSIILIKRIISRQLLKPLEIIFVLNPNFYLTNLFPNVFVYILKLIDGIYLDLVLCSCFQTIQ